MATNLAAGEILSLSIAYFDAHGNEISPSPVPDATPSWSASNSAAATLALNPGNLTGTLTPVKNAVGQTDKTTVSVIVGGVALAAELDTVNTAGAVASIAITAVAAPDPAPAA